MDSTERATLRKIGRNIKAERARRDLTQEALARAADLGPAQIARMERGDMDTGITKYVRVARALGVDVGVFFQGLDH